MHDENEDAYVWVVQQRPIDVATFHNIDAALEFANKLGAAKHQLVYRRVDKPRKPVDLNSERQATT